MNYLMVTRSFLSGPSVYPKLEDFYQSPPACGLNTGMAKNKKLLRGDIIKGH